MKKTRNYTGSLEMKLIPYLFIAPNALIFLLFIAIPALCGLWFSLTDWKGLGAPAFIGLENYVKAFADVKFWQSLGRTCIYVAVTIPLIMTVPLLLAHLMVQDIRGRGFFRAAYYWPSMISYIVVGISFKFIFGDNTGIVNYLLSLLGVGKVGWLTGRGAAMAVAVLATVWSRAGFYMVTYIAGLQSISQSYYEAARVDGANGRQQFLRITLPLLKPTTFLVLILGLIDLFKAYGLVISLTKGGPVNATKFVVQFIYERAFDEMNMGYASALSMLLFLIIGAFTAGQFLMSRGGQVDA